MPVKVKICGLSTPETLRAALEAGADMIGLVLFPKSPRNVSLETAAELAELARGHAEVVVLMVDPDDDLVRRAAEAIRPDLIQLHGSESPERVAAVRALSGVPVMKVIKVETAADALQSRAFRGVADRIMFDAKAPKGLKGALPGGNGITFDWRALEAVAGDGPYMLSGGLTPDTVAAAVRLTGAPMVDVSSGVERRPGEKDCALIGRFVAEAQAAGEGA
ncbi:MAG: phosphoribosylanthranilate isomerase [Hyphomicrobiaceae bacterium]